MKIVENDSEELEYHFEKSDRSGWVIIYLFIALIVFVAIIGGYFIFKG